MACVPHRTHHMHYINDFQMIPTTISHLLQAAIPVCTILNTFVHAIGLLCTTHIDVHIQTKQVNSYNLSSSSYS